MMRSRDASHYAPLSDIAAGDHSEQKFGFDRAKNLARVYARHSGKDGGGREGTFSDANDSDRCIIKAQIRARFANRCIPRAGRRGPGWGGAARGMRENKNVRCGEGKSIPRDLKNPSSKPVRSSVSGCCGAAAAVQRERDRERESFDGALLCSCGL